MGRGPREDAEGTHHHVTNRGARRDLVFFDDADRFRWLQLLGYAIERTGGAVHGFCLLGNHYHLLLESGGDIGATMKHQSFRYVRYFNDRHGFDGPLHKARFHSEPTQDDSGFLARSRYVHQNVADIFTGPLVDYRWSSLPILLGRSRQPTWFNRERTLDFFDGSIDRYHRFVEGDLAKRRNDRSGPGPEPVDLSRTFPDVLGEIIDAVCTITVCTPDDIEGGVPGRRSPARLLVSLLSRSAGIPPELTAAALGYASASAIRTSSQRALALQTNDDTFAELYLRAQRCLSPDRFGEAA